MRKKEQSNISAPSQRRFTLPKSHILRGRRNFNRLFTRSHVLTSSVINLRYACPDQSEGFLVSFIAPKRIGNAVQRNRTKRIMREAYRLQQTILKDILPQIPHGVHLAFIAKKTLGGYHQAEQPVETLLHALRNRLTPNPETTKNP